MFILIKMLIFQVGYYNIMSIKETYKPKDTNVKKLEIFLKKLENGRKLGTRFGK